LNLAVTAIGRDRPGIVAAITGALLEAGGNVDDSQMSNLHGHFAVMLIVSVPDDASAGDLSERLEHVGREFALEGISVSELTGLDRGAGPSHVLTVYGADQPGIVHAVADLLAGRGVNITDLRTRRTGATESPLYTMMMELALPGGTEGVGPALEALAAEKGVEVSLTELGTEAI
jgi:glycine cleavage system transcriptional repressor